MTIRQILSEHLEKAFEKSGYDKKYGSVTVSNRPDLCQYQCNGAMAAAKEYKKAPLIIAKEVVENLGETEIFAEINAVAPGFINLNLSDEWLAEYLNKMQKDKRLLLPVMEKKKIVVDYGGPNIAKPLHVGHLRSAIIGDSLCRLARFLGHDVVGDVHLGDWGLQMGLVMAEIECQYPGLPYFDNNFSGEYPQNSPVTADELNVIYPSASAKSKVDDNFAKRAAELTVNLQNGKKGLIKLWEHIRSASVADLKASYDILGVSFDKWFGESDADPYIPKVINKLEDKKLLVESEGAKVVNVALPDDKEPMPPMIVVKSNGGDIYGTTDLGTMLQRMEDWNPDEIWYVVDNRQALHFKQVFRCAALAGILPEKTQCFHIGFGTMNGKDGKPYKTRDGGVMRLSDMIESATSNALEKINLSDNIDENFDKEANAQTIGVAALKIGDFINHRTKDYIFDLERFLATDGKTGPYLQYACVRIHSVLNKALFSLTGENKILQPASNTERDLMLCLINVSDDLLRAYAEKAPNVICENLFEIAGIFNRFYAETKILSCDNEKQKKSWLALLSLVNSMLETLLGILGIKIPEKM